MKKCTKCEQRLGLKQFYKCPRGKKGRKSVCKTCHRSYAKKRKERLETPDYKQVKLFEYPTGEETELIASNICVPCFLVKNKETFACCVFRGDSLCEDCLTLRSNYEKN